MYCVNMQASANTETVFDPSTSHLTDALHIKASTAHPQVLVTTGDSAGRESTEEVKGNKSSWFRRLKRRDDMVALETSTTEKGLEVGVRSVQLDCVSQNVGRPCPNWQAESNSASKLQKTIEGKDYGEARSVIVPEKALTREVGRSIATSAVVLPTEMGFGPWLNRTFGRRPETEKTGADFKNVVDVTTNGHEFCKEVQGNSYSAVNAVPMCSLGNTQGESTAVPALCKPPLSPIHSKHGLPPRPPCQKSSGFHSTSKVVSLACGPGRGVFHELAIENQASGQTLTTPVALVLDVQDRESGKHGEATFARIGSSFHYPRVVEGSISDSTWHSRVLADCSLSPTRMGNGGTSSKQQPRPIIFERGNAPGQHIGSCSDVAAGRMLEDGVPEPVRANVLSSTPGMDLQLKFVDSGTETSKNGSMLQAASLELSKSTLQQSLSAGGSHRGKMNVKVAKASSSATLPWELFVEPAGASKTAREQFVEVYNRARDELKNQRLLQTIGRELDGGPKLTLGPSGATSDVRVECQSFKHGQQSSGSLQFQGKNTKLSLPHPSSLKEQNAMIAAEGSQCKQAEGFRRVQPLPEGPLRSRHKTVVQEGNMEVSFQRMGEGPVIHGKVSRTGDNEGPSNPVCDRKELLSKLDNDIKCTGLGQGPRESQKLNNGQEVVPVLSKNSRVTFEDRAMSVVAEKGAASRPRAQSKPHLWLQRWHSAPKYNSNGMSADTRVAPDGKRKFRDEDGIRVFGQANASAERVKFLKASSSKVLPSAAAMAIVGTAARQFCSSQPQGKGSFAFWSGFGIPAYRKVEPVQEEEKVFLKANKN